MDKKPITLSYNEYDVLEKTIIQLKEVNSKFEDELNGCKDLIDYYSTLTDAQFKLISILSKKCSQQINK